MQHDDSPQQLSTSKPDQWGSFIEATMGREVTQLSHQQRFAAEGTLRKVGDTQICRLRSDSHQVECGKPIQLGTGESNQLQLCLQLEGYTEIHHGHRKFTLKPGDCTLNYQSTPYTVSNINKTDQIVIITPRASLPANLRNALHHVNHERFFSSKATSILSKLMQASSDDIFDLNNHSAKLLNDVISGIFHTALADAAEPQSRTHTLDLISQQCIMVIQQNYADENFSVNSAAKLMRCSIRQLQRALSRNKTTFMQTLTHLRLKKARQMLCDSSYQHLPIANIAYLNGFKDAAHFSRLYRQSFKQTPGEWRNSSNDGAT